MAKVLIEESTLTGICDAIRAKKETTDLIAVPNIASEIEGITGGSGESSELVKYVHFMSEDGTRELFAMPVLSGDDCKDPIVHGDIETPTKESTVQYNYTYSGWSATSGGTADSTILQSITEDKIVYAAFAESVRYYTVNFYDDITLIHTEQVAYNGSSSYIPTKQGYGFVEWAPEPKNITTDLDCYASWVQEGFAVDSWEVISERSKAGTAAQYYNIGDSKAIDINGETVEVEIIGFNHDVDNNDAPIGLTLACKNPISTYTRFAANPNYSYTYINSSYMRNALNDTIYNYLPTELQNAIIPAKKMCGYYSSSGDAVGEVVDKLWLLAEIELFGKITYSIDGEGNQYERYLNDTTAIPTGIIVSDVVYGYYLRSMRSNASTTNLYVLNQFSNPAGTAYGKQTVFAFCI